MSDGIPAELFLSAYPEPIRLIAEPLRSIVRRAVPEAIEAVRPGWGLIGYDLPVGRRSVYFCWVAPELEDVHLGFPHGVVMDDPGGVLLGAGVTRQARWVTLRPGDRTETTVLERFVREGARVARMSRGERLARAFDRESGPTAPASRSARPSRVGRRPRDPRS